MLPRSQRRRAVPFIVLGVACTGFAMFFRHYADLWYIAAAFFYVVGIVILLSFQIKKDIAT